MWPFKKKPCESCKRFYASEQRNRKSWSDQVITLSKQRGEISAECNRLTVEVDIHKQKIEDLKENQASNLKMMLDLQAKVRDLAARDLEIIHLKAQNKILRTAIKRKSMRLKTSVPGRLVNSVKGAKNAKV